MLKYYFYKIYNDINNNLYIGITADPIERQKQHWNKLSRNAHPNPHLQSAWNKYGKNHFYFMVIEENEFETKEDAFLHEQKLIQSYDAINNGYNCNPGGMWTGPKGKFTESEIYYIKATCYFYPRAAGTLMHFFNCKRGTIDNIRCGRNYKPYCHNFDLMSIEEKRQWYEEFCDISDFEFLKYKIYQKPSVRKYTKEQVFIILRWAETKFTSAQKICDSFGIDYPQTPNYRCANKFREIREGRIYKDYIAEYKLLTEKEKVEIERLYTEMYTEKSL